VSTRQKFIPAGAFLLWRYTMEQKKEPVVPIGEKYTLTLREASVYFGIGEKKIRRLVEDYDGVFSVRNGNRFLVIRPKFEQFLCETSTI